MLTYASVCDGIGAAHVAWNPLGWRCAWTSEIDPFPAAVVDHHWNLPNLGDMTRITDDDLRRHGPVDLLVGGTPCQSFSVAGLRKGLADPRGNLALVYLGLADRLRPRWLVWENVPGVLSSNEGRDFGSFLGAMAELGYGFAYRVLDAQYVRVESHARAVPQRRRRVFVVGHLGGWQRAAAVLLEREGMRGHPALRREAPQGTAADAAPSVVASGRGVERTGETRGQNPAVAFAQNTRDEVRLVNGDGQIAGALNAASGMKQTNYLCATTAHTLRAEGFDASEDGTGRGTPIVPQPYPVGNCLTRRMHKGINTTVDEGQTPVLAAGWDEAQITSKTNRTRVDPSLAMPTLAKGSRPSMCSPIVVRRLTPRECERLQGFPDDYTAVTYRGKPAADGPRYKALGNSMAVNVMSWIGRRIQEVAHA